MKKMKILATVLWMAFVVFGMIPSANALSITPTTKLYWFLDMPTNPTTDDLASASGYTGHWGVLYKQEVGGGEEGAFANSYNTTFTPAREPKGATIAYDGSPDPYINGNPIFLLVKDGRFGHYLFNLSKLDLDNNGTYEYSWNGRDPIVLSSFYDSGGSISHVTIYGTNTTVPEPTTLLLLGFGLVGLAGVRRKFHK
jgi:hypothetical protein